MWGFFKKLLSRSKILNAVLGDVIYTTPQEHGAYSGAVLQWRVKKSIHNRQTYIAAAMKADASAGPQGLPRITSISISIRPSGFATI